MWLIFSRANVYVTTQCLIFCLLTRRTMHLCYNVLVIQTMHLPVFAANYSVSQKRLQEREPHHNIKIGVGFFAFRLDYMGSSSLLANLTGLQVSEKDEWKCTMKG